MRLKGTNYDKINELPDNAQPVSLYARDNGTAVGYVYIKHDRHFKPKEGVKPGKYPGYIIRCFQGSNYVIPQP
mgnify:CR=1 FL=1